MDCNAARMLLPFDRPQAGDLEPGDTVPIELGHELLLLGDNASAVQFSINGQAGRLLGAPGDVLSARIGRDDYQDFLVRY